MGSCGSSLGFFLPLSVKCVPTMLDMAPLGSGNALPLINSFVKKGHDSARLAGSCDHTCPCGLWEGTREKGDQSPGVTKGGNEEGM